LGKARNELFAQFLARIYFEIEGCTIAEFSTQKALVAPNFKDFRKFFLAKLKKCFIVPADTFDNVKGKFPVGFKIWNTEEREHFKSKKVDVYDSNRNYLQKKEFSDGVDCIYINDWIRKYRDNTGVTAKICYVGNDFQNNNKVQICSSEKEIIAHDVVFNITQSNLIEACIYFAVRKVIPADWLNDRDQFFYPNDGWKTDLDFQNDCLTYTVFSNNNNIQSKYGVNHWIPFTEYQVAARDKFDSRFMTDFIRGKVRHSSENTLFLETKEHSELVFSPEAKAVFSAGRELWKYYHALPEANVNASLYDIREHFQGRNGNGKMNSSSSDERYTELITALRDRLKTLARKIEPKIFEYGFLK
jgi:hypothetical protein